MRRQLDPEVRQVIERARALIAAGDAAAALALYTGSFDDLVQAGDHFQASNVAHMAGVAEPDPQAKHTWNQRALAEADAVAERETVAGFYSSLHHNLAHSYSLLGDLDAARRSLREAWSHLGALDPENAAKARQAIARRMRELGEDPER